MKQTGKIAMIAVVWLAVMVQVFINQNLGKTGDVIDAFSSSEALPVEACVSAYGEFGEMELAGETKTIMLRNLAKQLGITDGYEITASEGESYREATLTKDGKYGKTVIQIVSIDEKNEEQQPITRQNILCDITIYDNVEYAMECKEQLEDIYQEIGMEPNMNVYVKGKTTGRISEAQRQELIDRVFKSVGATVVQKINTDQYDCIYGYTGRFDRCIYQNGKKINVNLAFTYNEAENITYLHLAVPYINQSF